MSKVLEKAEQFLAGYVAPQPPPKCWGLPLGQFELPGEEEWDAIEEVPPPPVHSGYPFPTVAYVMLHPGGGWEIRYCLSTEDGRWLRII